MPAASLPTPDAPWLEALRHDDSARPHADLLDASLAAIRRLSTGEPTSGGDVIRRHAAELEDCIAGAGTLVAAGHLTAAAVLRRHAIDAGRRLAYFHARPAKIDAWARASEYNRRKRFAANELALGEITARHGRDATYWAAFRDPALATRSDATVNEAAALYDLAAAAVLSALAAATWLAEWESWSADGLDGAFATWYRHVSGLNRASAPYQ